MSSYTFTDIPFVRKGIFFLVVVTILDHAFFLFLGAAKKEKKALGKKEKEAESALLSARLPAAAFAFTDLVSLSVSGMAFCG